MIPVIFHCSQSVWSKPKPDQLTELVHCWIGQVDDPQEKGTIAHGQEAVTHGLLERVEEMARNAVRKTTKIAHAADAVAANDEGVAVWAAAEKLDIQTSLHNFAGGGLVNLALIVAKIDGANEHALSPQSLGCAKIWADKEWRGALASSLGGPVVNFWDSFPADELGDDLRQKWLDYLTGFPSQRPPLDILFAAVAQVEALAIAGSMGSVAAATVIRKPRAL